MEWMIQSMALHWIHRMPGNEQSEEQCGREHQKVYQYLFPKSWFGWRLEDIRPTLYQSGIPYE